MTHQLIPISIILIIPNLCGAGQFLDKPDIGNNSYLNARYLNHTTGRFLTQDDKKQFNSLYVYGNGQIIRWADPSGNMMNEYAEEDVVEASSSGGTSDGAIHENVSAVGVKNEPHNILDKSNYIKSDNTFLHKRTNRVKAKEVLSMSKSIEIDVRQRLSGVYKGQILEDRINEATEMLYSEYKDIRKKHFFGTITPTERARIKEFHSKLEVYNTPANRAQIRILATINSKTYKEMSNELIRIYADGH